MKTNRWMVAATFVMVITSASASAQVGKSLGLIDFNTASKKDLSALPHMTSDIVKNILDGRPFESITQLNRQLLSQSVTPKQAGEIYAKAFIHINLNTSTRDEIMLIPGAGKKMSHEFAEYRPWKT